MVTHAQSGPATPKDTRLLIAREAARLFLSHGVAETSGDDIAAAAGVSKRTVWRHFRNKESCIEPLFAVTIARFGRMLRLWPLGTSIEDHLRVALPPDWETQQMIADGALAVHLVALCARDPDVRTTWLNAYHLLEADLHPIISQRSNRSVLDLDVRLCAATISAAIRIVDESISIAVVDGDRSFTPAETVDLLADAIRRAATLPICDPVSPGAFLGLPRRRAPGSRDR
jgi:AcrR family transcriptional regulator